MKTIDYINLPYKMEIVKNKDNTYFVSIKELPGCMSEGDTIQEALDMIEDAKKCWIETAIENNIEIPLPEELENKEYSGKLVIRIPKSLHKNLAINAEKNNVSLNTYINTILSENNAIIKTLTKFSETLMYKLTEANKNSWQLNFSERVQQLPPVLFDDSIIARPLLAYNRYQD